MLGNWIAKVCRRENVFAVAFNTPDDKQNTACILSSICDDKNISKIVGDDKLELFIKHAFL